MDNQTHQILSDRAYNLLKPTTTIILPAAATLYAALAGIWGLPAATEVIGTVTAVNAFLGIFLSLTTRQYNRSDDRFDGDFNIFDELDRTTFQLDVGKNPDSLEKDEIRLKINRSSVDSE